MFEHFSDYMYYLLTSPFKRIRRSVNQWYILFRVLGKRFDDAMESLYFAQEQTMVATCVPEMLQIHAQDRGMKRYPGEDDENFRKRIANYVEILRLGGSDEGVLLAVWVLGYDNAQLVKAKDISGDESRWAEFYIIIRQDMADSTPIEFSILQKQVRKYKYVGALDNYRLIDSTQKNIQIQVDTQCATYTGPFYNAMFRYDGTRTYGLTTKYSELLYPGECLYRYDGTQKYGVTKITETL